MLVLSQKVGKKLILDGGIEVVVMDIQRGQVRLGISAPKTVKIYREEIYEKLPDFIAPPYG